MSKTVKIYRAQSIGTTGVPSCEIFINAPLPSASVDESAAMMGTDAKKLVDALKDTLPGGTFERMAVLMLQHMVSALAVPFKPTSI